MWLVDQVADDMYNIMPVMPHWWEFPNAPGLAIKWRGRKLHGEVAKTLDVGLRVERMYQALAGTLTNARMADITETKKAEHEHATVRTPPPNFKWKTGERMRTREGVLAQARDEVQSWYGREMMVATLSRKLDVEEMVLQVKIITGLLCLGLSETTGDTGYNACPLGCTVEEAPDGNDGKHVLWGCTKARGVVSVRRKLVLDLRCAWSKAGIHVHDSVLLAAVFALDTSGGMNRADTWEVLHQEVRA